MRPDEPRSDNRAQDRRDRGAPDAGARRQRPGHARDRRRLPRPHARPAGPPRALRPRRAGERATCRPAPTTPPRTRRSCSARRWIARSATARASTGMDLGSCRWTRRGASCTIDISGRPFTLFEAQLPPGSTGGFDHELTEEFFRALANSAKLTLHLEVADRHERPSHDRGGVQGLCARPAPSGGA